MTAILLMLAIAAPVPKGAQFALHGWGEPVDPLKDCKFELAAGKLTVMVPGTGRDLNPLYQRMDAPRVLRDLEGDFALEVTVDGRGPKGTKPTLAYRPPFFSAGLHVAEDEANFIQVEKTWMEPNHRNFYVNFEVWQNGVPRHQGSVAGNEVDPAKPTLLRLVREKDSFTAKFSEDAGRTWRSVTHANLKFADRLRGGVSVINTTDAEFKPAFSDLKVEVKKP